MSPTRLLVRVVLVVALFAVLVGGAYLVFFRGGTERNVRAAEAAYEAGVAAYEAKDAQTAALRFDEASLLASQALDDVEQQIKGGANLSDDVRGQLQVLRGRAYLVKALALRDRVYAQHMADNRPLPETTDSVTGARTRNITAIPDSKVREEAIICLRNAAVRLKVKEVQQEALRHELLLAPLDWEMVRTFSKNLLELDGNDARALFMMARYEFEQPEPHSKNPLRTPRPWEKRSRERVQAALGLLEKSLQDRNAPQWRALHLKAKAYRWLAEDSERKNNVEQARKDRDRLGQFLFGKDGALARAQRGEGFKNMSAWDRDGALEIFAMAATFVAEEISQGKADPKKMFQVLDDTLTFCHAAPKLHKVFRLDDVSLAAVNAISIAQPYVAIEQRSDWVSRLASARVLATEAAKANEGQPAMFAQFAKVLQREAFVAARRGKPDERKELETEALKYIQIGMQAGAARKAPPLQMMQLHEAAADIKLMVRAKKEEIAAHAEALRKSSDDRTKAYVDLLDGALFEREGRLEKAREKLEKVAGSPHVDLASRAQLVLVNVYLAMNQPEKALRILREFESIYSRLDNLVPEEKVWAYEFVGSPADRNAIMVISHLAAARNEAVRFARRKPKQPEAAEFLKRIKEQHEDPAEKLLERLPPNSRQDEAARRALVAYLIAMNRYDKAKEELQQLRKDYPASIEVLQLEIPILVRDLSDPKQRPAGDQPGEKVVKAIDEHIQAFLKANPDSMAARLHWASWLIRTNRPEDAVKFLNDPVTFPGEKTNSYYALLAAALLRKGDREESEKLLKQLPENPAVDAILIQMASTLEQKQERISQALARYERHGLFRCWDAAQDFGQGKFEEAAQGFYQALDFTHVKLWAQRGLLASAVALANSGPAKARRMAEKMIGDSPNEPMLYLAYAYASLLLDDLGTPGDTWPQRKNMAAALDAWERLFVTSEKAAGYGPAMRAQFWIMANRLDVARNEIGRALNQNPEHYGALNAAVLLAIENADPALLAAAEAHIGKLQQLQPKSSAPVLLKAQLQERNKQYAAALQTYQGVLEKDPDNGTAYLRVVRLLEKSNRLDDALEWTRKLRRKAPGSITAVQLEVMLLCKKGNAAEAAKLADSFAEEQLASIKKQIESQQAPPKLKPDEITRRKQQFLDLVRRNLAIEMAAAFSRGGEYAEAETRLKAVLKENPDWLRAHEAMAELHVARKEYAQAARIYEAIMSKDKRKQNFVAANNLAWLLAAKLDRAAEAVPIVQEFRLGRFSRQPLPGDRIRSEFLDTIGVVYAKAGKPELYAEMRDLFEAAIRRHPRDPRMHLYLGHAYAGLQQAERARQAYTTALALAADSLLEPEARAEVVAEAEKGRDRLKKAP